MTYTDNIKNSGTIKGRRGSVTWQAIETVREALLRERGKILDIVFKMPPETQAKYLASSGADLAALSVVEEALEAAEDSGWNDADGRCWCATSREGTDEPHRPQCRRLRAALARAREGIKP